LNTDNKNTIPVLMEFTFCWSRWTSKFPVKGVVVSVSTGCFRNPGEIPNPVLGGLGRLPGGSDIHTES